MEMQSWTEVAKFGSGFALILIGFFGKRVDAKRDKERLIDQGLLEHKVRIDDIERRLERLEKS